MTKGIKIGITLLVFAIAILLAFYHGIQFRKDHLLAIGVVVKCDNGGKGDWGPGVHYKYYADSKWQYASRAQDEFAYSIGKYVNGKSFPVAYKKYWYGYASGILMTPKDFELYGHPFPDSLKWILQYIKK